MIFSPVLKMNIKNHITAVMNVPGNLTRSSKVVSLQGRAPMADKRMPMEIALVLDMTLDEAQLNGICKELASCIKGHSELLRNTRVNMVYWSAERIDSGITSLPQLIMGQGITLDEVPKQQEDLESSLIIEPLLEKLRKFYARTKVVFLITDGSYEVQDRVYAARLLQPFLGKKMIVLKIKGEAISCERFRLPG